MAQAALDNATDDDAVAEAQDALADAEADLADAEAAAENADSAVADAEMSVDDTGSVLGLDSLSDEALDAFHNELASK